MSPTNAEPCISWQPEGRTLMVKAVGNMLVTGGALEMAASWRFSEVSKDPRRKKVLAQLKAVIAKVSDPDGVPNVTKAATDVTNAVSLKAYCDEYFSLTSGSGVNSTRQAAFSVLGDSKTRRSFTRNLLNFQNAVWETPLLYQVGDIPLSKLIVVRVDHVARHKFLDVDGVVGRAMFSLLRNTGECLDGDRIAVPESIQRRNVSGRNPSIGDKVNEIWDLLQQQVAISHSKRKEGNTALERKEGNTALALKLCVDLKRKDQGVLKTMNNRSMIRWILGSNQEYIENLFAPGVHDQLLHLLGLILLEYGKSQLLKDVPHKLIECHATLLATLKQNLQRPHLDYSDASLVGRRPGPKPWSADIPLVKGGLYLNVWHGHDERQDKDFIGNQNFVLHVPLGFVLLWRGDLIHGGGYDNALRNGATRLHLYIPMKRSDILSLDGVVSQEVNRHGEKFDNLTLNSAFSPGEGLYRDGMEVPPSPLRKKLKM